MGCGSSSSGILGIFPKGLGRLGCLQLFPGRKQSEEAGKMEWSEIAVWSQGQPCSCSHTRLQYSHLGLSLSTCLLPGLPLCLLCCLDCSRRKAGFSLPPCVRCACLPQQLTLPLSTLPQLLHACCLGSRSPGRLLTCFWGLSPVWQALSPRSAAAPGPYLFLWVSSRRGPGRHLRIMAPRRKRRWQHGSHMCLEWNRVTVCREQHL